MMYIPVLLTIALLTAQAYSDNSENQSLEDLNSNIPPECVDKEICLTKPIDYPTEDIERIARQLKKRWKRQTFVPEFYNGGDSNNCATSKGIVQPYLIIRNESRHFVVQSELFTQTFPSVSCRTEKGRCFQDLILPSVQASCRTKHTVFSLIVYVPSTAKLEQIQSQFPIDCSCELETKF